MKIFPKQKYKPGIRTCSKCWKDIDKTKDEYVMLISKKGQKIKEFFIFHKKCWMEHFEEYWELEGK